MSRRQKVPPRPLTVEEQRQLERLGRAQTKPAAYVARAKALPGRLGERALWSSIKRAASDRGRAASATDEGLDRR